MKQILKGWVNINDGKSWLDDGEIFLSKRNPNDIDYDFDDGRQLRILMANALEKLEAKDIKTESDYDSGINGLYQVENVQIQLFASDVREKLEDIQKKVILNAMGLLNFEEHWYGYSIWTIEGFNTQTFQLGGHNILEILENYKGKWIYLTIDLVS